MQQAEIWLVKLGSSLLLAQEGQLNEELINSLAAQIAFVRQQGKQVILISSGSVALGSRTLKLDIANNKRLENIQAAAAVGQTKLIHAYQRIFAAQDVTIAQLLLTHYDFQRRRSYLNARTCLRHLLDLASLPIINENDTIMDEEVCFGDNDTLAAMTANLILGTLMIILSDVDGLYTNNPRADEDAELIKEISLSDRKLDQITTNEVGELGRGGMRSKIKAARLAAQSGTSTIIANGTKPEVLRLILKGKNPGTKLISQGHVALARKRWLAGQLFPLGRLYLDRGAVRALQDKGVSLLPIGVIAVIGKFERGDPVSCYDDMNTEIARGLVNYSSTECSKLKRLPSAKIGQILGYEYEPELIHRDNLALLK